MFFVIKVNTMVKHDLTRWQAAAILLLHSTSFMRKSRDVNTEVNFPTLSLTFRGSVPFSCFIVTEQHSRPDSMLINWEKKHFFLQKFFDRDSFNCTCAVVKSNRKYSQVCAYLRHVRLLKRWRKFEKMIRNRVKITTLWNERVFLVVFSIFFGYISVFWQYIKRIQNSVFGSKIMYESHFSLLIKFLM